MSSTPGSDGTSPLWVKSTHSSGDGGNCVEWAPTHAATHGLVPVRDSKDPHGPALGFTAAAWTAFVTAVRNGDLPTA
jgi:hypothetical protein